MMMCSSVKTHSTRKVGMIGIIIHDAEIITEHTHLGIPNDNTFLQKYVVPYLLHEASSTLFRCGTSISVSRGYTASVGLYCQLVIYFKLLFYINIAKYYFHGVYCVDDSLPALVTGCPAWYSP